MFKLLNSLLFFAASILFSCSERNTNLVTKKKDADFSSFEISYHAGWGTGSFYFHVDSNKIYVSPYGNDNIIRYGLIPDTVFRLIDSSVRVLNNSAVQSATSINCHDCSVLSIKVINGLDTTGFLKSGDMDVIFMNLVDNIGSFLKKGQHSYIGGVLFLETQSKVIEMPPPIKALK